MSRDELLKQCKFYKGGGMEESDAVYGKGGHFVECWVAEDQYVSHGGLPNSDSMRRYVNKIKGYSEIPINLRIHLADSLEHFNKTLFYESPEADFLAALRDLFSYYINYKARK